MRRVRCALCTRGSTVQEKERHVNNDLHPRGREKWWETKKLGDSESEQAQKGQCNALGAKGRCPSRGGSGMIPDLQHLD